jgi:hypothetical protein
MRGVLWKVWEWALLPLRILYGDNIYTLWTNRDLILNIASALVTSGGAVFYAASQGYGVVGVVLFAVGGLLLALWLVATGIERRRRKQARQHAAAQTLQPADAPEEKPTPQENRVLLYKALTDSLEEGLLFLDDPDYYEVDVIEDWEKRTSELIAEALGQGEVNTFLLYDENVEDPSATPLQLRVANRLQRLHQLIDRVDSLEPLELQSSFDGREWVSKR